MTTAGPALEVLVAEAVSVEAAREVAALEAAAAAYDGVDPLDDQVRLELGYGAVPGSRHVLGRRPGDPRVLAYAHLAADDDGVSAHLFVSAEHRREGLGAGMLDHLTRLAAGAGTGAGATSAAAAAASVGGAAAAAESVPAAFRVWAHGDTAGAQALATARGFRRARDLWQMRRPLALALPAASYPADVSVRAFEPGRDDDAWVALNAAAFADHPEQGKLTVDDLRHRIAQPWFDASGFFVAERDGTLLGSHWTKVHLAAERPNGAAIGEVYAVGVHPGAQGLGLGKALTLTGLDHLRGLGLGAVMLYVDGDNAAAVSLYRRLGFETTAVDVVYAAPG